MLFRPTFIAFLFFFGLSISLPTSKDVDPSLSPEGIEFKRDDYGPQQPRAMLRKRNAQADGVCTVVYNCPNSGTDSAVFLFTGELTAPDPTGGGILRSAAEPNQALIITQPANKDIHVFPARVGEDWTVQKCKRVEQGRSGLRCLITWKFSLAADMPNPNSLAYIDYRTASVTEICVREEQRQCPSDTSVAARCTVNPGTGCQ